MKRGVVISGLYVLVCLSCSWNKEKTYNDILRPVRVAPVTSLQAQNRIYTGVVEAEKYTELSFKSGGPLIEMNVEAGQMIKKGKVIAVIDPLDYQSRYEANRAAYITARSQLERDKRLLAMQAISVQEYEISQANYAKTRSAYLTSGNTLRETQLVAPFDGFVEKKYVENYQKVQAGEPIIKLVDPGRLAIRFTLPETSAGLTRIPMKIKVEFDTYKGLWFDAKIKEYVDASPDGGGIPVKVVIDDSVFNRERHNIYPGFSARVSLEIKNEIPDCYLIPLNALFEDMITGQISVWLYQPASRKVFRQPVETGELFGQDKIMIKKGLQTGDILVIDGVNYITEGQVVNNLGTPENPV